MKTQGLKTAQDHVCPSFILDAKYLNCPIYTPSLFLDPLFLASPPSILVFLVVHNSEHIMSTTDNPTTQQNAEASTSAPSTTTALQPPAAPFAATSAVQDSVPPSARTSFTLHYDDDELRSRPSTSRAAPVPPVPTLPASHESANNTRVSPIISMVSEAHNKPSPKLEMPAQAQLTVEEPVPQMPQTYVTFLLISGKRRTMSFEPETTIGRVKELVWNSWPADWQDDRPPAPSYLRVLYLGRMLQDDETLIKLKLPTHTPQQPPLATPTSPSSAGAGPTPTIMHLSIRPYAPPGEGDTIKKKRRRGQDDGSGMNDQGEEDGGGTVAFGPLEHLDFIETNIPKHILSPSAHSFTLPITIPPTVTFSTPRLGVYLKMLQAIATLKHVLFEPSPSNNITSGSRYLEIKTRQPSTCQNLAASSCHEALQHNKFAASDSPLT
ncbi:unnamed protein product [Cyclocybe aegerita]|uniref:Ubiquitin-like domain-containing protein n=1 Tax=Cyclocybe aegerita TaxID=1973307 RepID=A0A8S0XQ36_CYCAE|nr:unnamed protein product [Cyclocybe aegerita]